MRFDFEGGAPAVADVYNPCVLPRRHNNVFAGGGQALQMNARGFVRAVLGPHHRKDAELNEVRLAT
jgi:hypothetical protein